MRLIAWVVVAAILAGCQKTFPIQLRSELTEAELLPFGEKGDRFIAGEAFMRQVGGGVVTCAGETVTVLPAVRVVEEAVKIWKAGDEIYTENLETANVNGSVRWTECDAQGAFAVFDLPPEKYYVMVPVRWGEGKKRYGGMLSEKVDLTYGSAERLILDGDDKFHAAKPWQLTSHLN